MAEENKYVLAMYDIRSKQNFIYKSTHMKEIVGASLLIRDCFWDFLRPAAERAEENSKGIYGMRNLSDKNSGTIDAFTEEGFRKHLEKGYLGEVVYDGGGNFLVLYRDLAVYKKVNQLFYYNVLVGTYSMRVLSSCIEGVHFDDYEGDRKKLYDQHRINEHEECAIHPVNTLPIVQVDYQSSMPLAQNYIPSWSESEKDPGEKVSYESYKKYKKYEAVMQNEKERDFWIEGAKVLDELITEKGEDSHLAIVYIDGNGMGAKVAACTNGKKTYEECIAALRDYSERIQQYYIDERIDDINKILANSDKDPSSKETDQDGRKRRRFVVYAGDEITVICNAKQAYQIAKTYLTKLQNVTGFTKIKQGTEVDAIPTSCAGIAIFHSHAPFADAYRIAEECCESGKKYMQKKESEEEASFIDYHYCQGAIGISLEKIRKHEGTEENSRPWGVYVENAQAGKGICNVDSDIFAECTTTSQVEQMAKELDKIGRSNIKGLAVAAKKSKADFQKELSRICAHQDKEKRPDFSLDKTLDEDQQMKLIYDLVLVYDLWHESLTIEQ